ncbi:MAG: A24 family peptidase [Bacillota bacterium]
MKGNLTMEKLNYLGLSVSDYLLILLLTVCIITDIKSRRVYNKVLVPFLIIALAANFLTGGWQLLLESLKGLLMGIAILIIPFARGGIGAGDVKLLAVIGGIKGPAFVISAFLAGAIAGGVFALIYLSANRQLTATLQGGLAVLSDRMIRYGIAVPVPSSEYKPKTVYFPYTLAIASGVAAVYATGLQNLLRW